LAFFYLKMGFSFKVKALVSPFFFIEGYFWSSIQ
jgi:hypothetical protein